MKKTSKILSIVMSTVLAFSLTACGKPKVDEKAPKAEEKIEGTLKIVTTSEEYKPLFDKFTNETGVKVEFLSMSSGEVLSRTKAEGNKPMGDVWFGGGIDAFMQAKEEGLLEQCNFEGSDKIVEPFKDKENYWFSKGLTIVGFIANNDILKEKNLEAPKSWNDLTDPKYKDEILMSNPAVSGTNYAVVNSLLQNKGEEAGWKYFEELNKNIPYYSKRGKDPNQKTAAGEVAIGITYLDNSVEKLKEEKNVSIIYPEDGIPWMPDGVAVFKNASNTPAAKKFVSWLYEDENLRELAKLDGKDTVKFIKPSLEGVELTVSKDKLLKQDLSLFGKDREAVLAKWSKMVGEKGESK
ncbi:iron(III) transport system substrate-binding protein [Clostridium collagenovorans DSM 3089]|uniref:Iron(III) transport system substrate-binding protein n=1 Tax=Clostridium collagenovorans DSM 3089 TaxID=1121306 RepID=A0A1M5XAI2_9CLOT|nr:ABC transporter substrate-binding protein [Clostridium collagenovorans]SHH96213.1 iron(III) transport system substrate-binding protein [Clostridium collagenovorans DSM 3089]